MSSNLKTDPEIEKDLVWAIAYGLRDVSALKPKKHGDPDPRDYAARKVVAYLKLANWVVTKGPPEKHHNIP